MPFLRLGFRDCTFIIYYTQLHWRKKNGGMEPATVFQIDTSCERCPAKRWWLTGSRSSATFLLSPSTISLTRLTSEITTGGLPGWGKDENLVEKTKIRGELGVRIKDMDKPLLCGKTAKDYKFWDNLMYHYKNLYPLYDKKVDFAQYTR